MFQLAADYEHKANLAEALETSLRTPYDQNAPLPEIFKAFLTPSGHQQADASRQQYDIFEK